MPTYKIWDESVNIEIEEEIFPDEDWLKEKDALFDNPYHGFFDSCHEGKRLHYRKNLPHKGTPIRAIVVFQVCVGVCGCSIVLYSYIALSCHVISH